MLSRIQRDVQAKSDVPTHPHRDRTEDYDGEEDSLDCNTGTYSDLSGQSTASMSTCQTAMRLRLNDPILKSEVGIDLKYH